MTKRRKRPMVPATFIMKVKKELGVNDDQLAEQVGLVTGAVIGRYRSAGKCPKIFAAACAGLVAEHRAKAAETVGAPTAPVLPVPAGRTQITDMDFPQRGKKHNLLIQALIPESSGEKVVAFLAGNGVSQFRLYSPEEN